MTYFNDEYRYGGYLKDEYGFPLSLSESMKYCGLDKVPCLKCEESGKSFRGGKSFRFEDRYCSECNRIIVRFLEALQTARRPSTLHRKEDCQIGYICYKLVD